MDSARCSDVPSIGGSGLMTCEFRRLTRSKQAGLGGAQIAHFAGPDSKKYADDGLLDAGSV
ncbi:hypothetical protein ABIE73_005959 [Bradyrhizobium yuanmingense]